MRGQTPDLTSVMILVLLIVLTLSFYQAMHVFQSKITTASQTSAKKASQAPPLVGPAYTQPPTPEKKKTTFCTVVRNPYSEPIELNNTLLLLYRNKELILTEKNTYNDCNSVVPPGGACKVCADVIIPSSGTYTYEFVQGPVVTTEAVKVPESHVSLYPDLVISSVTAHQHHYRTGTLLFGDYNTFTIEVTICNRGRDDMNTSATLVLSANNAALSKNTLSIPALHAGECNTFTIEGNTTSYDDVTIRTEVKYPYTELSKANNNDATTFDNAYYLECSSKSTCESDLNATLDFITTNSDNNAYVVLTEDITGEYITFPRGDYEWRVTFDGNGHEVYHSGRYALFLRVKKVVIRNIDANAGITAIYLGWGSSASIQNSHISADKYAIHVEYDSHITIQNSNLTANNIALYLYDYSSATLTDSNIAADTNYALYIKWKSSATLQNSNLTANNYTVYLYYNSSATIQNTHISADKYAIHVDDSHITIQNSNIAADTDAVLIENSSATLQNSNLTANNDALYLDAGSRITSATNAYCFFSGDPTPYPILSIDQSNYDLNISKYLEENAPGSPALCHVSVLADGVKIHDGNVGAVKDGNYLSSGAIMVSARDVNIYRVSTKAYSHALHLLGSSVTLTDSNISADKYAIHVEVHSHITIQNSNIAADTNYALYIKWKSSATLQNSNLTANMYAIRIGDSNATLTDSHISANMYAISLSDSNATIQNSNIAANTNYALYIKWKSSATLQNSNLTANNYTVYLYYNSSATIQNTHISAKYFALLLVVNSSATLTDSNLFADSCVVYSYCDSCTNDLTVDLSEGNVYITSPGYDWYIDRGILDVDCINCGVYCLKTQFNSRYGSGSIDHQDCDACLCGG